MAVTKRKNKKSSDDSSGKKCSYIHLAQFKSIIKTRKLMHTVTRCVFPLDIQNNMLHFFLIQVVKQKRRTLDKKLEVNM